MSTKLPIQEVPGFDIRTYVVEGATLMCTFGTNTSKLLVPKDHGVYTNGKKRANIGDNIGGLNILPFGPCKISIPPVPCSMATAMKWINGKENVLIDGEPALVNLSMNFCALGGVITIINDGQ